LCAELREDALELVEAFGIAPEFVDAPMTARHD